MQECPLRLNIFKNHKCNLQDRPLGLKTGSAQQEFEASMPGILGFHIKDLILTYKNYKNQGFAT